MLRKSVAGLATQVANDKGDSPQESGAPTCAVLSASVRIPKYHSMAYWWLDRRKYPTGRKVTDEEIKRVNLKQNKFHGEWNYTIYLYLLTDP
jgi:hypothetical protein